MNLSRFFTLAEMSHSNTAVAQRIPNLPGDAERAQLTALCTQVLDPLRAALGHPIRVTSGFRGPALNARIRGSTTSQHMRGQAADLQTAAVSVLDLFKMVIRLGLPFDQLIFEAKNASTKWVHVSHNPAGNRGKICVAQFDANGRAVAYPQVSAEQALALVDRVTRASRPGQWPDYHETADEPVEELAQGPAGGTLVSAKPAPAPAPAPAAQVSPVKAVAAKKAAAKKAAAKKVPAKKAVSKKPLGQNAPAKKAAAKKVPAKKAPAKKTLTTKTPTKKVVATKKPASNKVATKKLSAKPVAAKKATAKPAAAKEALAKKAPVKKAPVKKAPAKKVSTSKLAVKKPAVKKPAVKRPAAKKAAAKQARAQ